MITIHIDDVQPGDVYNGKTITYKGYARCIVHIQFDDWSKMIVSNDSWLLVYRS